MSADSGRFLPARGGGWRSRYERTGREYASVFPEPCSSAHGSAIDAYRLSNSDDIASLESEGHGLLLDLSRVGESETEETLLQRRMQRNLGPGGEKADCCQL